MIFKKDILATINKLDDLYENAPNPVEATYYCKLAVIELCGWIEFVMDEIAKRYVLKKLKNPDVIAQFLQTIDANNNFSYSDFKRMLHRAVGFYNWEVLHSKIPVNDIVVLDNLLETLKQSRNEAAHEHIKVATAFQATSVTRKQLTTLYPIFRNFYIEMGRL